MMWVLHDVVQRLVRALERLQRVKLMRLLLTMLQLMVSGHAKA